MRHADIPKAVSQRLSLYLRHLESLQRSEVSTVSSSQLGRSLGLTAAQVRKDLAYFGQFGFPGVGYKVQHLIAQLRRILGTDKTWLMALVGVGNLGRALVRYRGFEKQNFEIVAVFDNDPRVVGTTVGTLAVQPLDDLEESVRKRKIRIAIIAVPAEAAQGVADRLVAAGIRGILNFAPTTIVVPDPVKCCAVDLAVQLEQLTFQVQGR
jgi:redox-sensing transcriptional repressor